MPFDIAKNKFDVALLDSDKYRTKVFTNSQAGFQDIFYWVNKYDTKGIRACLEATGDYGTGLATFLFNYGIRVSVVNPAQIKGFAKSELSRTKTDKADAKLIARFCKALAPGSWSSLPEPVQQLQALARGNEISGWNATGGIAQTLLYYLLY
ncbi:MAG: IS110 family transposase [Candidatus Phlomobacter fragariae]